MTVHVNNIWDFIYDNQETQNPSMEQEVGYAKWLAMQPTNNAPQPTNNAPQPTNMSFPVVNAQPFDNNQIAEIDNQNMSDLNSNQGPMDAMSMMGQFPQNMATTATDAAWNSQADQRTPPVEEQGFFSNVGDGISDFWNDEEKMARMTIALNSMRLNPDANIAKSMENKLEHIRKSKGNNKTATQLRKMGRNDLAEAVESGSMDGKTAWSLAHKAPSAFQDKIKWAQDNPDLAEQFNVFGGTNIDMGVGDKAWYEGINKTVVKRIEGYQDSSRTASDTMNSYQALSRALQDFGTTGTFEEQKQHYRELADKFGLGTFIDYNKMASGQTVQAFTNMTVANELRKNKGPQTDFDALFAKSYVPSLGNRPEANTAIMNYGQSLAKQKQILGDIARNASLERPEDARKMIKNVQDIEAHLPGAIQSQNGKWVTFIEYYNSPKQAKVPAQQRLLTWANAYREEQGLDAISIYQLTEGI